jgi:hypothetical protein
MKKSFFYFLLFGLSFSCNSGEKKSADSKSPDKNESASGDVTIKFKADGQLVNTTGWIVQRFLWDEKTPAPWLNIVSNMHMDKRTINVNLNGTSPGKYILQEDDMKDSHGMYSPDFAVIMDSYSFVNGEFNLTEVDTIKNIINGMFSGVAKNIQGKTVTITDGQLMNVKMKPGVSNLTEEADKALKQQ